jgi:hypothetical protein
VERTFANRHVVWNNVTSTKFASNKTTSCHITINFFKLLRLEIILKYHKNANRKIEIHMEVWRFQWLNILVELRILFYGIFAEMIYEKWVTNVARWSEVILYLLQAICFLQVRVRVMGIAWKGRGPFHLSVSEHDPASLSNADYE